MQILSRAKSALARFRRDQEGVASVEALLLLPLLMWAYVATFVFFDAYRTQTDGLRVNYAISAAIAREDEQELNQQYLDNMLKLASFMTRSPQALTQRVTIVCFSEKKQKYRVAWSRSTGPKKNTYKKHTHSSIDKMREQLPDMPYGDQVIVVETFMDYRPLWDVGLDTRQFDYFSVIRPRFTNQIKWEGKPNWKCKGG